MKHVVSTHRMNHNNNTVDITDFKVTCTTKSCCSAVVTLMVNCLGSNPRLNSETVASDLGLGGGFGRVLRFSLLHTAGALVTN